MSTPSSAASRFEPRPTVATSSSRSRAARRTCLELRDRSRLGVRPGGAARADRRQPRELDAFLEDGRCAHPGSPSTIARAIFHGSPTPKVITRSPGRAQASARVAASSSDGAHPARTSGGSESTTSLPGDALARRVARADDVGHDRGVGEPERLPELHVELARALDDVRLVDGDQPAARQRPRRAQRHLELGRVVAVVVVDRDAAPLADELEPPPHSREAHDRRLGLGPRDAGELERRERGGRVLAVVLAGHRELELDGRQLPAPHDLRAPSRASRRRRRAARPRTRTTRDGRARCS